MVYGYIRVSNDKQTVENQRFEINNFCKHQDLKVDIWIEETISGTRAYKKRRLGVLLKRIKREDIIICTELSRLGRSLFMIMEILSLCMEKGCKVWTIKDGYRLGDDIQSKVLAFAFGISAEIERELISQRTKEALARRKVEGINLGRRKGTTKPYYKLLLHTRSEEIEYLFSQGLTTYQVARRMRIHRSTLIRYMERRSENGNTKLEEYNNNIRFIKNK